MTKRPPPGNALEIAAFMRNEDDRGRVTVKADKAKIAAFDRAQKDKWRD